MHIQFQVEASRAMGHGHVMRCAAMAKRAGERGMTRSFLAANGYTEALLRTLDLSATTETSVTPDVIVMDHRNPIDPVVVRKAQATGSRVLLLDQRGPARAVADGLCDALIGAETRATLPHSDHTTYFYGLEYVLLRTQFRISHAQAEPGRKNPPRLMVAMGGVDQHGVALRLAAALSAAGFRGPATFVVERDAVAAVQRGVSGWQDTCVHTEVTDMALLMLESDLLVSKLGGLMLEAFCVGLGTAMIEPSKAHVDLSASLAEEYSDWPAIPLGLAEEVDMSLAAHSLLMILRDPNRLAHMGRRGSELVDGLGCDRLLTALSGWAVPR